MIYTTETVIQTNPGTCTRGELLAALQAAVELGLIPRVPVGETRRREALAEAQAAIA